MSKRSVIFYESYRRSVENNRLHHVFKNIHPTDTIIFLVSVHRKFSFTRWPRFWATPSQIHSSYIDLWMDRQTDRWDRQTGRQTDRQTHPDTHTHARMHARMHTHTHARAHTIYKKGGCSPHLQKGEGPSESRHYRLISLSSCVSKLLEHRPIAGREENCWNSNVIM